MSALQSKPSARAATAPAPDRVWLAIAAIPALLLVVAPEQAQRSVAFTAGALLAIGPFLLLSVAIAAHAGASGADRLIARAFHGRTSLMVVTAALVGALSPFCSCGVIPLVAALLGMGVPLAPVMAFWLASPIMDPSMFVLTAGTLGLGFAVAKTAAAVGIGVLGGLGVQALGRAGLLDRPLRAGAGDGGCAGERLRRPGPVAWRFWQHPARRRHFLASARGSLMFLGKWLTLAFLLESLMLAYVPDDLVAGLVGGDGWRSVATAVLAGIPAYLNGYAALPLVDGLLDQGMAPGAAMAFLLAGGVSSVPAAMAVYALARPPVFSAYLGFAYAGSLAGGLLYAAL